MLSPSFLRVSRSMAIGFTAVTTPSAVRFAPERSRGRKGFANTPRPDGGCRGRKPAAPESPGDWPGRRPGPPETQYEPEGPDPPDRSSATPQSSAPSGTGPE